MAKSGHEPNLMRAFNDQHLFTTDEVAVGIVERGSC
jgi:hypothetical protein